MAEAQQPEEAAAIPEAPQPEAPVGVEPEPRVQAAEEAPSAASTAEPVADASAQVTDAAPVESAPVEQGTRAKKAPKTAPKAKAAKSDGAPREGSKTAQVVAMLQRKDGVTISEIMATMGWQKHYADVRIMPTCVGSPACGAVMQQLREAFPGTVHLAPQSGLEKEPFG